jgi:hypothetical protein
MKMASIAILVPPLCVLAGTAIAVVTPMGLSGLANRGPHGFSEILYAFSSMGNNNGSAFAGYGADNPLVNFTGGLAMLLARYWVALPVLAIAGLAGGEEYDPGGRGHIAHPYTAVRGPSGRGRDDCRRAGLYPGAGSRADRGGTAMTKRSEFEGGIVRRGAGRRSCRKLDPRHQMRNPVMFVVFVGSVLTTALGVQSIAGHGESARRVHSLAVSLWLWFTVLFGNFAEAMAEGRGKAQAQTLRKSRREVERKEAGGAALRRVPCS